MAGVLKGMFFYNKMFLLYVCVCVQRIVLSCHGDAHTVRKKVINIEESNLKQILCY